MASGDEIFRVILESELESIVDEAVSAALGAHTAQEGPQVHGGVVLGSDFDSHTGQTTGAHGGIVSADDPRLDNARDPNTGSVRDESVADDADIGMSKLALAITSAEAADEFAVPMVVQPGESRPSGAGLKVFQIIFDRNPAPAGGTWYWDGGQWQPLGTSAPAASTQGAGVVTLADADQLATVAGGSAWRNFVVTALTLRDEITRRLTPEAWRTVGASGQPSFASTWVNYDPTHRPLQFRKDVSGRVHLRGAIRSGGASANIFTLPAGYRPSLIERLYGGSGSSPGRFDVLPAGTVVAVALASTGFVSLNGLSFDPD